MKPKSILLFITFAAILSAGCLVEEIKKAEMTLDTGLAETTGNLNSREIKATEFMDMYMSSEDYVLLDVRTKKEYDSGHIPGAVNIPYTQLDPLVKDLGLAKDQKIVVYCEVGVRSKIGSYALQDLGYTNIVDVTDGIRGWRSLGGDISTQADETAQTISETKGELAGVLISAQELSKNIDSYTIIFLGTKNQYDSGHIPGALHINPLSDLVDPEGRVPHLVLKKNSFEALMSGLGIEPGDTIVVYDSQPEVKYSTRMFWTLKLYGHDKAAILNGGLASWKTHGGELTLEIPQVQPTVYSSPGFDSEIFASLDYVNLNLYSRDVVLVEATTKEEYELEGHIPGAVLVEPEETLKSDGTFMDEAQLLSLYTSKGVVKDKEIVTYCHTGHRGATVWFELKHLLGYPDVRLFDGSLEEWNSLSMPIEMGSTPTPAPTIPPTPTTTPAPIFDAETDKKTLDLEPVQSLKDFKGTKTLQLSLWEVVKLGDSYIYLTGDMDGCVGIFWWDFNIYQHTTDGGVFEGSITYMNERVGPEEDITSDIHRISDSLDEYTFVVKRWSQAEGLTLEISG